MAERNLGGRPRLYSDPIYFEERVEAYFDECETKSRPPTLAGISYFLGFEDKESFMHYADYEGFSRTVKRARLRIEGMRVENLVKRDTFTPGQIFDLKCNFGYRENNDGDGVSYAEFGKAVARALKTADAVTTAVAENASQDDAEVV